jgi:hypothetical protein
MVKCYLGSSKSGDIAVDFALGMNTILALLDWI